MRPACGLRSTGSRSGRGSTRAMRCAKQTFSDTFSTFDLIEEHAELQESYGKLHQQLVHMLPEWVWSVVDPYGPRKSDVFHWSWRGCPKTVEHERHLFLQALCDLWDPPTLTPLSV